MKPLVQGIVSSVGTTPPITHNLKCAYRTRTTAVVCRKRGDELPSKAREKAADLCAKLRKTRISNEASLRQKD